MKLINNRFKLDKVIYDSLYSSLYQVIDLWENDRRLYLKLYNEERHAQTIDYFINNFMALSKIKHENLLLNYQFDIINTIDGKKVNIKQYYSTIEHIDAPSLDKIYCDLGFKERLNILLQVATVLDFLHHKGIIYRHLSPSNIYVSEDNSIKLLDLATIYEDIINTDYDDLTRNFMATEVLLEQSDIIDKNADKYSFGILALYLLTKDVYDPFKKEFNYISISNLNSQQREFLNHCINSFTMKTPSLRDYEFKDFIEGINQYFHMDFQRDLVKERGTLDFQTKIIGREREINRVLNLDYLIYKGDIDNKVILVEGNEGTGKTRILQEISHLLRLKGRVVYNTEIGIEDGDKLKPMTDILRQAIKDTPVLMLNKYAGELSRIVPELKPVLDINNSIPLENENGILRLFDRTANYFEELSENQPIYIIIDNFENCSLQLLYMIDYLINNMGKGKIVIIASYNKGFIVETGEKGEIISKWSNSEIVEEIFLSSFDLSEIGGFIQCILGISYKPLKFSAVILRESQGNPKCIEYMIKDLYANGKLYFNPEGYWEVKAKKYTELYFAENIGETLEPQINLIKDEHKGIMKIVSVYYDAVSKNTLQSILNMEMDILNEYLEELVAMKLLDVRVSDWGYNYSINNIQLKKSVYYKIPENERMDIHKKIGAYLLESYSTNYNFVMDEIIHHLMYSNQAQKALELIINSAKENNLYSYQSVLLWEEAYEIDKEINSIYKMEILENLGNIYGVKGENDKALKIYEELFEKSSEDLKIGYAIIANNGMVEIYIKKNLLELAIGKINKSIILSMEIGDLDLLVKSRILYNKILLEKGEFIEAKTNIKSLLELCLNNDLDENLGNIYNILGLIEYYSGNMDKALNLYEKSIEAFQKSGDFINSTKAINNIANIYTQYGENKKAMEYYEKGLNIVKRNGIADLELTFLNNIGSIYTSIYQYEQAIKYMEKARIIAVEIEDANLELLTSLNLSTIHLLMGNFEESYNYYIMLKEAVENHLHGFQIMAYYYNYLSEFYFSFGQWEKSLEYAKKGIKNVKDFSVNEYMASKTRMVTIKYFIDNEFNKNSIEEIRAEYRMENINYDRRYALLQLGFISLVEGDLDYLRDIIDEDGELAEKYPAPKLDYIRGILVNCLIANDKGVENLIKLETNMKKCNLPQLDLLLNILLGMKFSQEGRYYEGINYLLEAQDRMYGLMKNINNRELQKGFIKKYYGDIIIDELNRMAYEISNKKISSIYIDELEAKDKIEKYFDFRPILEIMNDEDFTKIKEVNIYIDEEVKDIASIDELVSKFSSNYESNLELILKFLAKESFAIRGYILAYNEDIQKYLPIISLNGNNHCLPNENLLALANKYEYGILINDNLREGAIEFHKEFLSKGTRALMCIPIRARLRNINYKGEDRRKNHYISEINEGYIYLETERVFNRFDKKRHRLADSLVPIIFINLENYKLKTLSSLDKLTGVSTRKFFEKEYSKVFDEARKSQGKFAVLMIDIDNFKRVNDTYGHRKGDEVLNRIGECLLKNIRNTDLVGRYGGEEFVIILKDANEYDAMKIGKKIRKTVEKITISKIKEPITVSIGIATFPKQGQFKEELIEKADQALYSAKDEGKNKVVLWDAQIFDTLHRVDRLAGIISGNINQDQRNILAILDIIDLVKGDLKQEEKIYEFLGRLIETIEAETCTLIYLDKVRKPTNTYSRIRLKSGWIEKPIINYNLVNRAILNKKGEFLIDWENINSLDLILNSPKWKSVIVHPVEFNGEIKGVIYAIVPLREKEFDYDQYNMVKTLSGIFAPIM